MEVSPPGLHTQVVLRNVGEERNRTPEVAATPSQHTEAKLVAELKLKNSLAIINNVQWMEVSPPGHLTQVVLRHVGEERNRTPEVAATPRRHLEAKLVAELKLKSLHAIINNVQLTVDYQVGRASVDVRAPADEAARHEPAAAPTLDLRTVARHVLG